MVCKSSIQLKSTHSVVMNKIANCVSSGIFCYLFFFIQFVWSETVQEKLTELHKCPDFETGDTELNLTNIWTATQDLMTDFSNTSFRLVSPDEFSCTSLTSEVTMFIFTELSEMEIPNSVISENNITSLNGSDDFSVNSNSSEYQDYNIQLQFTSQGILKYGAEYFRPDEFCIQRIYETRVSVRVCEIDCQDELTPCIPICCPIDKSMFINSTKGYCRPSKSQYNPTFYNNEGTTKLSPEVSQTIRPHFYKRNPACPLFHYSLKEVPGSIKAPFRLLRNGKVKYAGKERRWMMNWDDFCLVGLLEEKNDRKGLVYSGQEEDQLLFTCWPEDTYPSEEKKTIKMTLYISGFIPATFFIFVTILVYILLWEKQNVHGWTILSFAFSIFFLFVFMTWNCFIGLYYVDETFKAHEHSSLLCTCIGVIIHFFFLSIFTWLSVINFDLWWTFKSMAPVAGRSKGIKRFICYSAFGWGIPTTVVLVGLTLQNLYPDPESEVIVPEYGKMECHLIDAAKGVYLYYIIGLLLVSNLIFMGLTFYTIYKFKEGTRAVDTARSNNSQNLSLKLFFKLFVVMGVTWIFEFVAWLYEVQYIVWYYVILDMLNFLQSIWICFIFVCKRKILNQLEQKYPKLKAITGPLKKITVSRRATRSITTMDGTRTTGFSGRKSTATSSTKKL